MSPIVVTFVSVCTALVAAIAGPCITLLIGKAQIRAAVLSANRQRWIDGFRDLVSSFCSQATTVLFLRERLIVDDRLIVPHDPELLRRLEQLFLIFTKIKLMINPTEADHDALLAMMTATMKSLRNSPLTSDLEPEMEMAVDRIVAMTQIILKREWLRVKSGQ